ncbi:MAG TPA: hypothetical protein VI731_12905, partial [Bacteroidia bacterium]|nr:hypothetical protein [Bacteroidia bacterium]
MAFPKSANRNSAVVFLFLFFLPAALFGQNKTKKASILEGPEVEEKRSSVTGIIGHDNTGYYVLRMQKTRYWIDHIDSRMQVDKTAEIPEPSLEKIELYFDF